MKEPKTAVVLHNAVGPHASAAEADVLVQAEQVCSALARLGWQANLQAVTLDLESLHRRLSEIRPDVVFNLVESLGGKDAWACLAVELLTGMKLPLTGSGSEALRATNDKLCTKRQLFAAGLSTPGWFDPRFGWSEVFEEDFTRERFFIIKPIREHASWGMNDTSVSGVWNRRELEKIVTRRNDATGIPHFGEEYIAGREFNLSLLEIDGRPFVLPPAEIEFRHYPEGKPHIVGEAAKWDTDSFEYLHTPRTFRFSPQDQSLLNRLADMAVRCWQAFDLRGYARVDFRVDSLGNPFILEINANPCLAPDAGFVAAVEETGKTFDEAVAAIVAAAIRPDAVPAKQGESVSRRTLLHSTSSASSSLNLRSEPRPEDAAAIRRIVSSTKMFRPGEIDVAVELIEERLHKGTTSGYEFLLAESENETVGYACFGRNSLTIASYDLYWIAVQQECRGSGIGSQLLQAVELAVHSSGGERIYIETSQRADYANTRRFYEKQGYQLQALLPDFYAPGDDRAIYVKVCG